MANELTMKLSLLRFIKTYSLILIAIFSLQGCAHSQVYKVDENYFFRVTSSDSSGLINKSDTFQMKITNSLKLAVLGLQKAEWTNLATGEKELRGITNNAKTIEIEPPYKLLHGFLTLLAPYPSASLPLGIGYSFEATHSFYYSDFKEKGVTQTTTVKSIDSLLFHGHKISTWFFVGNNNSHFKKYGKNIIEYWFNESIGFIKWKYYFPNGKTITFEKL